MEATKETISTLRNRTGAGMLDCKEALQKSDSMDEAVEYLKKQGLQQTSQDGTAAEGAIGSYVHNNGQIGVIVEVNCETDFAASTDEFETLVDELAMQIAAQAPEYVTREDIPDDVLSRAKADIRSDIDQDKPDDVRSDIIEGKLEANFFANTVLFDQTYIRDDDQTIEQLVKDVASSIGEAVEVRRFERFRVGAGKKQDDDSFVDDVADQLG